MKRLFGITIIVAMLALAVSPGLAGADEITLNWASFLPKNTLETKAFQEHFVDKVNEKAKGKVKINYRGGPEAVPPVDLGKATQKGIIDLCTTTVGWYEAIVPGVGAMMLTNYTPAEEFANAELMDYVEKMHAAGGLRWLGRAAPTDNDFFYIFLNKKAVKPADFKGMKLGTATAARAAAEAWGAAVTPVKISDYFTAMERKMVDGIPGCPPDVWVNLGCQEVTKYVLDYQFYKSTATAIMNLDSWNKLPDDVKQIMMDTMKEYNVIKAKLAVQREEESRKKLSDAGVEFYKFDDPNDGKWLIDTAYSAAWDYQRERFPEVTEKLEKLLRKQ